jgi:hypothetical protein
VQDRKYLEVMKQIHTGDFVIHVDSTKIALQAYEAGRHCARERNSFVSTLYGKHKSMLQISRIVRPVDQDPHPSETLQSNNSSVARVVAAVVPVATNTRPTSLRSDAAVLSHGCCSRWCSKLVSHSCDSLRPSTAVLCALG